MAERLTLDYTEGDKRIIIIYPRGAKGTDALLDLIDMRDSSKASLEWIQERERKNG